MKPNQNIVITGFMGTGKTSISRELARRLGRPFLDMDGILVKRLGMPIGEIFRQKGEEFFREEERKLVLELSKVAGAVISTGGGTVLLPENREALEKNGKMVCLEASPEVVLKRLSHASDRPLLLEGKLRERVFHLLEKRKGAYAMVQRHIDTTRLSINEVVERLLTSFGFDDTHIFVQHEGGGYQVFVEPGLILKLGKLIPNVLFTKRISIVTNSTVKKFHGNTLKESLEREGISFFFIEIPDGEKYKNLRIAEKVYEQLGKNKVERTTGIVSFGGGVVCDLTGFVASTYMRGIPIAHIPTTFLSQLDAGIGGKTGINHSLSKNLIGTFYDPNAVFADPLLLRTLKEKDLKNGFAEAVKNAILGSPELFEILEKERKKLLKREIPALTNVVKMAGRVKAQVVSKDPFEKNERRLLNLGHTIGHALETVFEYKKLSHGEAVSIGLVSAVRLAQYKGFCEASFAKRVIELLKSLGLPTSLPSKISIDKIWNAILLDKKVKEGVPHFVLPKRIGEVSLVDNVTKEEVIKILKEIRNK